MEQHRGRLKPCVAVATVKEDEKRTSLSQRGESFQSEKKRFIVEIRERTDTFCCCRINQVEGMRRHKFGYLDGPGGQW